MIFIRTIVALTLFILSSVTSAQVDLRFELNNARDEWQACVAKEIIKLDDRISPATDIPTVVQMSCVHEHNIMVDMLTISAVMRATFSDGRVDLTKQLAVKDVLQLRAQKRQQEVRESTRANTK